MASESHGSEPSLLGNPEFWVLLAALTIVGIVFWKAGSKIGGFLDSRAARIRAELEEAERLREEAQRALADIQRRQRDTAAETEEILAQAKQIAKQRTEELERKSQEALKRREQQALDRIAQAEATALADVRNAAVTVALAATSKVVGEEMEGDAGEALVERSIKDLSKHLN